MLFKNLEKLPLIFICLTLLAPNRVFPAATEYDICVYGGTSAGVIAAYSAAMSGKKVVLVEPGKHLGGMSSGGLGYTDIGNKYVVTGLARDFYRRIGKHYGKFEQWIFEPRVAEKVFMDYVAKGGFKVLFNHRLSGVSKESNVIRVLKTQNTLTGKPVSGPDIKAKVFIDCTYEGDLMAAARVSYTVGREANGVYNETFNGVQVMDGHQMPPGVDPYIEKGRPQSGLLWGVNAQSLAPQGSGDKKVQAYNFRICLTNRPENRIPVVKPEKYDPSKYQLLLRLMERKPWKDLSDGFIISMMPNGKTDINNKGGMSTDMIGANWKYPDADYAEREKIIQAHTDYTKGLLYFIGNDPAVPGHIRKQMKEWGYPKDEYVDNGHWSHQLYVREARRMVSDVVMTQHHCQGKEIVEDGIGMAAYTMDSHNCDRVIADGFVKNEGNVEIGGFGPYPVSYRSIVPRKDEAANLFVPVCLSASHIAYGSIRMEPVFMVLGQAAAIAGCQAIDNGISVQDVDVKRLNESLQSNPLCDGRTPEILVDNAGSVNVRLSGQWKKHTYGGYGPDYLVSESGTHDTTSAEFSLRVKKSGTYSLFIYIPKVQDLAGILSIVVFDGKKEHSVLVSTGNVEVSGQTSGEWVKLGDFHFDTERNAQVRISATQQGEPVVADAILAVPVQE